MNNSILEIGNTIENARTIYIGSHVNPDGDNLGSSLALFLSLRELGKDVKLLYVDDIPENYKFLPGIDLIEKVDSKGQADLFIALDSADLERLGRNMEVASNAKVLMNIDHHISNPKYGDINRVIADSSSTAEVVYDILKELKYPINHDIATNLYIGISSDTGSFMYSNTSGKTHRVISELYEYDIDTELININLYQNRSLTKTKLFSKAMDKLELYYEDKLGLICIDEVVLNSSGSTMGDTEGLVENIRDIQGIEVAVLLKVQSDSIRVSTRSKEYVDVSKVCAKFNGGGHIRASGCTMYGDIEEAKKDLIEEIGLYI